MRADPHSGRLKTSFNIQPVGKHQPKQTTTTNIPKMGPLMLRKFTVYWHQLCSGTTTFLHIWLWSSCEAQQAVQEQQRGLNPVGKSFLLLDDDWYWSDRRSAWAPLKTHTQRHRYWRWTRVMLIQRLGKNGPQNFPFDYREKQSLHQWNTTKLLWHHLPSSVTMDDDGYARQDAARLICMWRSIF